MPSLQDQLLKAGMVDEKKAKKIQKQQRKEAKQLKQQPKDQRAQESETKLLAKKAQAERVAKDKEINRQRDLAAHEKAIAAQIRQLINTNKIDRGHIANKGKGNDDIAYQFTHGKKIKKLYVTTILQAQLINGVIAIVVNDDKYELVPAPVAEQIKQRNENYVLVLNENSTGKGGDKDQFDEDDPYADYQIPDDLMW
ncbi:MAG: DUF2058 domain-containing protein [Pseudomonadales bacterium]